MEHAACQHTAHQPHAGPLRHCWQPGAAEHCAETVPTDATTRMKEVMGDIGAEAPMSGVFSHTVNNMLHVHMSHVHVHVGSKRPLRASIF